MLEGNKEDWSKYCIKCKLLKQKIGEKRRVLNESYMQSIWECKGHFDHLFSNTKTFFCVVYGIYAK